MRAPVPKERSLQRAILRMAATCFPDVLIHHSAVVKLTGTQEQRARQMGALKCDGFKPGFPDLACFWRGGGAFIEVKREKGGVVSPAQIEMHARLTDLGWPLAVVRSVDEAADFLEAQGAPCVGRLVA